MLLSASDLKYYLLRLPRGMEGTEDLVLVKYEMLPRGYSEDEIIKVGGRNFMRALKGRKDQI